MALWVVGLGRQAVEHEHGYTHRGESGQVSNQRGQRGGSALDDINLEWLDTNAQIFQPFYG